MWLAGQGSNLEPPDPKLALNLPISSHHLASVQLEDTSIIMACRD